MELLKVLSEERTLQYLEVFVKVFWESAQRSTGSCVTKQSHLVFPKVRSYLSFSRVPTGLLELSQRLSLFSFIAHLHIKLEVQVSQFKHM